MRERERLFVVMLAATVVLTIVLSGLVVADLVGAHRAVPVAANTSGQADQSTDGGGAPGGAVATPGAQGAAAKAAPGAAGASAAAGKPAGVPTVACPHCGVGNGVVQVGSIVTQTGPGRSLTMAHAIVSWAKDVNRRGGINGWKVNVDMRDDAGNPDTGAAQYHALAEDEHVLALLAECAPITDAQEVGYVNQQQLLIVGDCQNVPAAYTSPYVWVAGPTPTQNGALGAKLMVSTQGWQASNGQVALVCLDNATTLDDCNGAQSVYGNGALWGGGPRKEEIADNNYAQLIAQWKAQGVKYVHLVLDPGSLDRYFQAAQDAQWNPPTFDALTLDNNTAASYPGTDGMFIGSPWTPLDQHTAAMQRWVSTQQTYYPDDVPDLTGQTGWISCLLFEHALQLMGSQVSKQALLDVLDNLHGWDTGMGPVENYSPSQHVGQVEQYLMKVAQGGTSSWHLVTVHGQIGM